MTFGYFFINSGMNEDSNLMPIDTWATILIDPQISLCKFDI